jgi:hypothetical protein
LNFTDLVAHTLDTGLQLVWKHSGVSTYTGGSSNGVEVRALMEGGGKKVTQKGQWEHRA